MLLTSIGRKPIDGSRWRYPAWALIGHAIRAQIRPAGRLYQSPCRAKIGQTRIGVSSDAQAAAMMVSPRSVRSVATGFMPPAPAHQGWSRDVWPHAGEDLVLAIREDDRQTSAKILKQQVRACHACPGSERLGGRLLHLARSGDRLL